MKPYLIALTGLAIAVIAAQCTSKTEPTPEAAAAAAPKMDPAAQIKRGEYLVGIAGCNDCHTPKVMTDKRAGAQHPAPAVGPHCRRSTAGYYRQKNDCAGSMGSVQFQSDGCLLVHGEHRLLPTLHQTTPVWVTGPLSSLKKQLREGKSKGMDGTRPLLPPMPWQNTAQMSDEDMRAIFAYLKSIPPVKNAVPNPIPPTNI